MNFVGVVGRSHLGLMHFRLHSHLHLHLHLQLYSLDDYYWKTRHRWHCRHRSRHDDSLERRQMPLWKLHCHCWWQQLLLPRRHLKFALAKCLPTMLLGHVGRSLDRHRHCHSTFLLLLLLLLLHCERRRHSPHSPCLLPPEGFRHCHPAASRSAQTIRHPAHHSPVAAAPLPPCFHRPCRRLHSYRCCSLAF